MFNPMRFSESAVTPEMPLPQFVASASSRSSSPAMNDERPSSSTGDHQQPRRGRPKRQGFSPSYKPSFHRDLAQTDINSIICEMQSRDGSVSWKVIADYINEEFIQPGLKAENAIKDEEMEDVATTDTKERLRGPIIPGSCNDRWHRHRIMYQVVKGRDIPSEWFEPWIDEHAAALPLDPAKSFYVRKIKQHLEKGEDVPAALVEECTDWLEQSVRNVMKAKNGGEDGGGREKKRVKLLEKEVKQLRGEVRSLREMLEEMREKMAARDEKKIKVEDSKTRVKHEGKMREIVEID